MNYYTADWHLGHKKIIEYSERPFRDKDGIPNVEAMNRAIIENTNATVGADDSLYILGDVAFLTAPRARSFLEQLVCQNLFLIPGNHDSEEIIDLTRSDGSPMWKAVSPVMEIRDNGTFVVLCHYAMRVWNKSHRDAVMLHGHSHGSLPIINNQSLDVGVDCWGMRPTTLRDIRSRLKKYPAMGALDHHKPRSSDKSR